MTNLRDSSKANWAASGSIEHINAGSLQRIADACELMAKNYSSLISELDFYKRSYELAKDEGLRVRRSNNSLRGVITRMKSRDKA